MRATPPPPELVSRLDVSSDESSRENLTSPENSGRLSSRGPASPGALRPPAIPLGMGKLNLSSIRKDASTEEEEAPPLDHELGMLGGPRLTSLPSHEGQRLPFYAGHGQRTVAPAATKRGGSLTYPAHRARASSASRQRTPRGGNWTTSAQGWPRAPGMGGGGAAGAPQPSAPAGQRTASRPASGSEASRPRSAAEARVAGSRGRPGGAGAGAAGAGVQCSAARRAKDEREREREAAPHRQLARTLRRQMAPEGHVGAHLPAPEGALPAAFLASIRRRHAALSDVTMVPATMRAWESALLGDEAVRRKLGVGAPRLGGGASQTARPPPHPDGAAPFSPHEMRRFLRHAQRYFLSVDPKQPFAVPRTGWDPGARTQYGPPPQ